MFDQYLVHCRIIQFSTIATCELTSASEMHRHTIILHFEVQGKIVKSKIALLNPNHKVRHVTEP
jgi:hypothetical protein